MTILRAVPVYLILLLFVFFETTSSFGQEMQDKIFVVGTKAAPPFSMKSENGNWSGISVDLWRIIAERLHMRFEFQESDLEGLIDGVGNGSFDAAVAALTITPEREKTMDFTHAFYTTGLSIAIPGTQKSPWVSVLNRFYSLAFLKVVMTLILLLLAVAVLVWWFEKKKNEQQFGGGILRGIGSGFWWSAVTMTTVGYGDKAPRTLGGRIFAIVWMFTGIIIISTFTAAITSSLTITHLKSNVSGPEDLPRVHVGTVKNSASSTYLSNQRISFSSFETLYESLRAADIGTVDAVVYDAPLLRYLVNQHFKGKIKVLPETFLRQEYGIGLPEDSRLLEPVNQILLDVIRDPEWQDILYRYLGG